MSIGFRITSKAKIRDVGKLLFAMMSDCREGIIAFLYPFDLFKGSFIITLICNNFQNGVSISFETSIRINPKFIWIILFPDMFLGLTF